MKDENKKPNRNEPKRPIDFFVDANPFVCDENKNTSQKKENKMKIQTLLLF